MKNRNKALLLLVALLALALALTGCGKKEPPAPTPTQVPPPAHGYPEGDVTGDTKLEILEKLETNHDLLYIFEATSRSRDVAKMITSTYESPLRLDGKGYVRGSGSEGAMKLTLEHLDERIYWKDADVQFRVATDVLGQPGPERFNRITRENSLQSRVVKAVDLPMQLAILKENVDLLDMNIAGDNVYFALSDTAAKDLKKLLQPQVDFVYYMSLRTGVIGDGINLLSTDLMLMEWVFDLSACRPMEISCQATTNLSYVGMRSTGYLETFYRFGLVTNPELPGPEKINWE